MAPTPEVDDLLRLVKAGVDPTLAPKPLSPAGGMAADDLVRMLGESAADPTGEKAAATFAAEGEVAACAKKRLKKLFAKLDVDGSGSIELPEFRKLLLSSDTALLGLPTCQLADIFDAVDTDGNDEVEYNEFLAWLGLSGGRVPQAGPMGEPVPMPEIDCRVDGPSFTSAGAACWKHYHRLSVQTLARTLGLWKVPDGFDARMELHLGKAEKLCLQLGSIEAELRARRVRARGAMRRWVADNFSLSSKAYMKRVEEAEKRDANVKSNRARLERDPEAREAAQLAGWTTAQQLGQLSFEHKQALEDLEAARAAYETTVEPVMRDLTAKLPEELFPQGLEPGPLRCEEAIPSMTCKAVTSLDAVHMPGEDVILCVDIRLPEDPVEAAKPSNRRRRLSFSKTKELLAPHDVDLLLVLDQSASMAEDLPLIGRAVESLIAQMDEDDRLSVIAMGDEAHTLLDWTAMTAQGRPQAEACVGKLQAAGGARFLPACETMLLQLRAAQASCDPGQSRQTAVVFLSDGSPLEARDAVFSFFSRRLAAFPSLLFAPVALGPEADASLMAELGRCMRGPAFYLPDETQIDEVLGQVWAAAGHAALHGCRVLLRPCQGCGLAETEDAASSCGAIRRQEEVQVSEEQLKDLFRSVVTLSTESVAFKVCKFTDESEEGIYLKEPLYAGTTGVLTQNARGKRLLVSTNQRLIGIRRATFLPKSKKIRDMPQLHFEAEEAPELFEQRPANRILCTGISRGHIELEFEPPQWSEDDWTLAEDVAAEELTMFKGSRLIGYRFGEHGESQSAEIDAGLSRHVEGGFRVWQMQVFESLISEARGRHLFLCFDVAYPVTMIQLGSLQRGGSRQVFARLRVPKSLEDKRDQKEDEEQARRLLDVLVVASTAQPDGTTTVIQHRLGLHVFQVPSLSGKNAIVRYRLKSQEGEEATDEGAFGRALAEATGVKAQELEVERERPGFGDCVLAGPGLSRALQSGGVVAATLDKLISKETCEHLQNAGYCLEALPTIVGHTALRRLAQWRLVRCLQAAADGGAWAGVQEVRELAKNQLASMLDPADPPTGALRSAALEAAAAEAASGSCERLVDHRNRLLGLAAAHEGQYPPSVALDALGISETEAAWEVSMSRAVLRAARIFMKEAGEREQVPGQVLEATFAGADGDSIRIRFRAVEGNGAAVTAYTLSARDCETGEVYNQSTRASNDSGFAEGRYYDAAVEGLPSGKPFTVVVFAWNGRRGLSSPPVFCTTPQHALHARAPGHRRGPARQSVR